MTREDKVSPFIDYKIGDVVTATCDFRGYNSRYDFHENVTKGETDVVESVSSNHHGGLQLNLVKHGRGWSNEVWKKIEEPRPVVSNNNTKKKKKKRKLKNEKNRTR